MKLTYQRAVEAQVALNELSKINLPVESSIEIARLSNQIDVEAKIFASIRDKLINDYQVKPSHTEREDMLSFTCSALGVDSEDTQRVKEENLKKFVHEFQKLLDTETVELPENKIKLPKDILIKPKSLKAIADFIEVV